MLQGKLALEHVPGVWLTKHCMTEARDHLAGLERLLDVAHDELLSRLLIAKFFLHLQEPAQALLVRQAMQRAGKAAQPSSPGVIWVAQSGAHEVRSVRGDVATLVVCMQHEVQSRGLLEILAVVHAQHGRVVTRPVEVRVVGGGGPVLEGAAVDVRGDQRDLRHQVQRVLESPLPVLGLLHALVVLCGELGILLQGQHADGELSHRMGILRQRIQGGKDILWQCAARVEFNGQRLYLRIGRNLASEEEPEGGLRKRRLATWRLRELLVALEERLAAVGDALVGIQIRCLRDHRLHRPRAIDGHLDGDILDLRVANLQQLRLEGRPLLGQRSDLAFQRCHDRRRRNRRCCTGPDTTDRRWQPFAGAGADMADDAVHAVHRNVWEGRVRRCRTSTARAP
mmetsp:Transcript_98787/g.255321  ORF Transcript_98787/g.255321 Transcript_98787/m.255321 type:complete len:397 (-) Transcript_98787:20-1210(-)